MRFNNSDHPCSKVLSVANATFSEKPGVEMTNFVSQHLGLSKLIYADHLAVQCTYFEKSAPRNWLMPIQHAA